MSTLVKLSKKDFATDQEVRWCPGCGDYAILSAVLRARDEGIKVSRLHLRYLSPFPKNLGEILERHDPVLLPENNMGQLALLLQGHYLKRIHSLQKVQGQPFKTTEILDRIRELTRPH